MRQRKQTRHVTFRVTDEMYLSIKQARSKYKQTLSSYMRGCVENALSQNFSLSRNIDNK
jgi:hypothetical protein